MIISYLFSLPQKILNKIHMVGVRWYWKKKLGAMGKHWNKGKYVTIQNPQCLFFEIMWALESMHISCLVAKS